MYRVWRGIKKGFVTFVCVGDDRKGRGTECMCLVVKQLEKGMCLVQMAHIYIYACAVTTPFAPLFWLLFYNRLAGHEGYLLKGQFSWFG